jgi:hypothetical protein
MNSPFARDQADRVAQKVPGADGKVAADALKEVYRRVLLRDPSEKELEIASRFINEATELQTGTPYTWQYGFADVTTAAAGAPPEMGEFTHFKHFHQSKEKGTRWSVSETFPDPVSGYLHWQLSGSQLSGHTGRGHTANVIRWVAPVDATIRIVAPFKHATRAGDGILTRVLHSRTGLLGEKHILPEKAHEFRFENLAVEAGDIITFAAGRGVDENSDSYSWTPRIEIQDSPGAPFTLWTDASRDFLNKGKWPLNLPRPQSPLSQLAHVLIISNEFQFVD